MAKLDNVIASLQKTPDLNMIKDAAAAKVMEQWLEKIMQPNVTPEELHEGFKALGGGMKALARQLKELQQAVIDEVAQRPTSFDPVVEQINQLRQDVDRMVKAISAIELPKMPEIPAFPDIPSVDLEPIRQMIEGLAAMIAELKREEAQEVIEVEEKPREWTFDVKRNQSGYIRSVDVIER
jgi:hypothetical protein